MGYWLTAHWPPLQEWAKPPLGVYLADGRQEAGQDLRPGDLVFVYQAKTGKPRKDGKPYRLGREAVVFLVRATTGINAHGRWFLGFPTGTFCEFRNSCRSWTSNRTSLPT